MGLLVDLELDSGRCGEGGMSVMGNGCIFCVERDGDDGPGGLLFAFSQPSILITR